MFKNFHLFPEEEGNTPLIWLTFLLIPLVSLWPYNSWAKLVPLLILLLFLICYRNSFFDTKLFPFWMGMQYFISFAYCLYYGYIYLFIYPSWMIGFAIVKKREFLTYYGILIACILFSYVYSWLHFFANLPFPEIMMITIYTFFTLFAPLAGRSIRRKVDLEKQMNQSTQRMEYIVKQEERHRIARDLHDTLGQSLSTMSLKTDLAERLIDKDSEGAKLEVREISQISRETLHTVREIVSSMRMVLIVEEMVDAEQSLRAAKIILETEGEDLANTIPANIQHVISYCIRESVTNVVRHSKASKCKVTIQDTAAAYIFHIQDDGIGFKNNPAGNGLTGLRERMNSLAGSLVLHTSAKGTTVTITVPKKETDLDD